MIDCSDVFGFQAQINDQAQFWFERWRDALSCKEKIFGNKAEINPVRRRKKKRQKNRK